MSDKTYCKMNCMSYAASKFYLILCVSLAVYTVHLQFQSFHENKDTSSVLYKSFTAQEEDEYPTWSVCFQSFFGSGGVFGEDNRPYWLMMLGKTNTTSDFASVEYDDIVQNFLGSLSSVEFDGKEIWSYDSDNFSSIPFDVVYQDPNQICFTKNDGINVGKKRNYDRIHIGLNDVSSGGVAVQYYLHQAGQLMKQLEAEFVFELGYSDGYQLRKSYEETGWIPQKEIQVFQVEILNKRPSSNTPCNPELVNEDMAIIREIIMQVGCIPMYWERFAAHDGRLKGHTLCDKKEQFERLLSFLPHYETGNHFAEKTQHLYTQPCKETRTVVRSLQDVSYGCGAHLCPKITYITEVYKLIANEQAFGGSDLWSQLGGCIGIFLGYSLLQVAV